MQMLNTLSLLALTAEHESIPEPLEEQRAKRLGHDIGNLLLGADPLNDESFLLHFLADEMVADVDVLAARVVLGVLGKRDAALAVGADGGGAGGW